MFLQPGVYVEMASESSSQRDSGASAGSGVYLAPASSESHLSGTQSKSNSATRVCSNVTNKTSRKNT